MTAGVVTQVIAVPDVEYSWHEARVPDGLEVTHVYGYLLHPLTGRVPVQRTTERGTGQRTGRGTLVIGEWIPAARHVDRESRTAPAGRWTVVGCLS